VEVEPVLTGYVLCTYNECLFRKFRMSCMPMGGDVNFVKFRSLLTLMKSESELLYDWRFTANLYVLATNP
jgi:hypothetical protein